MTWLEVLDMLALRSEGTKQLLASVDSMTLLEALARAEDEHARVVICDLLGERHEAAAVDQLLICLCDPSSIVRSSAADGLAKSGDSKAGPVVLQRLLLPDDSVGVRRMLVAALGAVKHYAAIPLLIDYLENPDPSQRGGAAWSLGNMLAVDALPALVLAIDHERNSYARQRMDEAIIRIERSRLGEL